MQGWTHEKNEKITSPNRKTIVLENFPKTGIKHLQSAKPGTWISFNTHTHTNGRDDEVVEGETHKNLFQRATFVNSKIWLIKCFVCVCASYNHKIKGKKNGQALSSKNNWNTCVQKTYPPLKRRRKRKTVSLLFPGHKEELNKTP